MSESEGSDANDDYDYEDYDDEEVVSPSPVKVGDEANATPLASVDQRDPAAN